MARASRTFRIFVSSTFADLKEERNALQERVFPKLRDFCLQHGARFQAIDLRWGVSAEAGLDQQTINICLDEVKRCQDTSPRPNFIVLLGDRYGWQPPPPQIPASDFDEIVRRVADPEAKALALEWYPLDENAVPPEHYLKLREGAYEGDDAWGPVERRLRAILEDAIRDMPLEREDRRRFETSATEQEIQRGALRSLEDHVFCYFRSIDFGPGDLPKHELLKDFLNLDENGARDETATARLARLRGELRRLPAENVHDHQARWTGESPVPITTDHIDRLCDQVFEDLLGVITQEVERLGEIDPVKREIAAHEEFGEDRARFFTGRVEVLDRIATYIDRPGGSPLVLHGASGSGKSTVLARAAELAEELYPGRIVRRFIGVTPDSSNGRTLLQGLCREISRRYGGDEATIPGDYRELVKDFAERLALASEERPLILFLDALDQLSPAEGARSLSWLPSSDLPAGVRLIVSTLPEDTLKPLEARLPQTSLVELTPMQPGEGASLLDLWLEDASRTLQPNQKETVIRTFEVERLPLWLKLAFVEARRWKSTTVGPETELPATIPEFIREKLFGRLADDANHGNLMVSRSLGYLGAAKNGLSEDEMIDVLSLGGRQGEVLEDFRRRAPKSPEVDRLPVVVWSRLYFDLEPYLNERAADGASLLGFYHRQLAEAVKAQYLDGDEGLSRHRELAGYFAEQGLQTASQPNLRKMSELPYQQTNAELWDDVTKTLTDFEFLERKATDMGFVEAADPQGNVTRTYTGIYQIRDDYALALDRMPGGGEGRAGGRGGRRRIIVTGVDFGKGEGYVMRCPHCNTVHKFQDDWRGDEDFSCPNCQGPLKVNGFVVPPRP